MGNDIKVYKKEKGILDQAKIDIFFTDYYYPKYSIFNNGVDQYIEDFKNGLNTEEYAEVFSSAIKKIFYHSKINPNQVKEFLKTVTIIPVPASSNYRQMIKYKKLFELISEKTGVINGFNAIKVIKDKEISHFNNNNTRGYVNYIINYSYIKKPYRVIYIDDVISSGETIRRLNGGVFDIVRYQHGMKTGTFLNNKDIMFGMGLCLKKNLTDDLKKPNDILVEDDTGFFKYDIQKKFFNFNILMYYFQKKYVFGRYESCIGNTVTGLKDSIVYRS